MYKHTAADFSRGEIFVIAARYSTGTYNYDEFYNDYMCSENTFYTILRWAVEKCIVSINIIVAMQNVSVNNSYKKTGISRQILEARASKVYQSRILKSSIYQLSKEEAIHLVVVYAISPLSKSEYCKKYFCTRSLLDRTITRCIVQCWIADETVETLRQKAYLFNDAEKVDMLFNDLLMRREKFKLSKNKQ